MAGLVLGPLQRHADETRVTIWVETDAACEVQVQAVPTGSGLPDDGARASAGDGPPEGGGLTSGGGPPSEGRLTGEGGMRDGGRLSGESSPQDEAGLTDGDGPSGRGAPSGGDGLAGQPAGRARTFAVAGHHYAVVVVEGLTPGTAVPYEVALDGEQVWPLPGEPPSLLRPVGAGDRRLRVAFGSCRVTAPQERPYTLSADEHPQGLGTDALHALALRMRSEDAEDPAAWPDVLLLLGDQVYADHVSPATLAWIRSRRDTVAPPGEEIADFEEYTHLYVEAWSQPEIRWLLSTVPTAMIFDDHDVRDDWNISAAWRANARAQPWWDERITGGIMAYWLYQHVGNLDPDTRAADPVFAALTAPTIDGAGEPRPTPDTPGTSGTPDDGTAGADLLRAMARRADAAADGGHRSHGNRGGGDDGSHASGDGSDGSDGSARGGDADPADPADDPRSAVRWSYRWDIGRSRLVVVDSRCARVVAPDGLRLMVDDAGWEWVGEQTRQDGDVDHLLLATSVPYLLAPAIHWVEAASESLVAGSRGRWVARRAEEIRQAVDLEHWPAFGRSFDAMTELLRAVAAGEHGPAPASVTVLSGDVHHAYLAQAVLPGARCPVHQAVCSPFRNPLGPAIRRVDRLARTRPMTAVARSFARYAGARRPTVEWQVTRGPWFDSQIAYLDLEGRANTLRLEKTEADGTPGGLDETLVVDLTRPGGVAAGRGSREPTWLPRAAGRLRRLRAR